MAIELLAALVAGAFLLLALWLAATWRQLARLKRTVVQQARLIESQEHMLQGLCAGARGLGDSVKTLEQRFKGTQHRLDDLDLREPGTALYRQAIERARNGADLSELVENYGLEPGEAELVRSLHQRSSAGRSGLDE